MTTELLQEIEEFLATNRLSETAFGKQAVNDGKFIPNIRNGRRVWPETAEKVRKFMREYLPPDQPPRPVQHAAGGI